MRLFQFGKELLYKIPWLTNLASTLYYYFSLNHKIIKGQNNIIIKNRSFLSRCEIKINGQNNRVILGDKCYFQKCKFTIYGNNNEIIIEDMVCAYNTDFYMEDNNNTIKIGEKTLICGTTHLAVIEGTSITIGRDCLFSSEVVFRTGDSHSILDIDGNRINNSKNIEVGDRVWIGHRVSLNKGSNVKQDSVIATGSIVTKPFDESNVILAGVPAKIIKNNISWDRKRI